MPTADDMSTMLRHRCEACSKPTSAQDLMQCGSIGQGYRTLCTRCFNEALAANLGLQGFEHVDFEPVQMRDARGVEHEFSFSTRLLGTELAIDAFEHRNGQQTGYEFQVIGKSSQDPMDLLGKLIGKMRRALAQTHVVDTELGPQVGDNLVVRGNIQSDPNEFHRVPMVVVDGREISWDDFGTMVASFEGWQFKMEFRDRSDEV